MGSSSDAGYPPEGPVDVPSGPRESPPPEPAGVPPSAPSSAPSAPTGIPWEQRERWGNVAAFWKTVTGVMTSPARFYRELPPSGSYGPAVLFALIAGLVGTVTGAVWNLLASTLMPSSEFGGVFANYAYIWLLAAFAPALILMELFFWSLITHVLLTLADAGRAGFRGTLRTTAYAQAPALLSIIPVCGGIAGGLWTIVVQIIGLREVHRTTTLRAAFATLFPLMICGGLLAVLLALGMFTGLLDLLGQYQ